MHASKIAFVAAIVLLATGCTHIVPLRYAPAADMIAASPVTGRVAVGRFRDDRGTGANWLGAIRGGYGNPLKTLRTEKPARDIVEEAFRDALRVRGLLAPAEEATFELRGSIKRLDCNYYFNYGAHAHLDVELVSESTKTLVFGDAYHSDQIKRGMAAGIFGSVETLRQLSERALRAAIDQVFDDASFSSALAKPLVGESDKLEERLRRLDSLRETGAISEDEYRWKRRQILNEL